jgi:hypothetical protein
MKMVIRKNTDENRTVSVVDESRDLWNMLLSLPTPCQASNLPSVKDFEDKRRKCLNTIGNIYQDGDKMSGDRELYFLNSDAIPQDWFPSKILHYIEWVDGAILKTGKNRLIVNPQELSDCVMESDFNPSVSSQIQTLRDEVDELQAQLDRVSNMMSDVIHRIETD